MTENREPTSESTPISLLRGITVLIVDDSPLIRRMLREILEKAGARVDEVGTGTEALHRAPELQPDVIVLDVELPDLRGPEVTRYLKELGRTAAIPILAVSASRTTTEDIALGLDVGADGYMTLPVDPLVFLSTLGALLRVKRATDRMARLQAFTAALAGIDTPEAVTALTLEEGAQAAQADGVAMVLVDRDGKLSLSGASKGWPAALGAGPDRLSMTTPGPLGICVWMGEPLWFASREALADEYPQLAPALPGPLALACIPMAFGGRTRGAVGFFFAASHVLGEAERRFLTTLVAGCTLALERGHARSAAKRAQEEKQQTEEALRASVQARNDLLAIVSHDLRPQPIRPIVDDVIELFEPLAKEKAIPLAAEVEGDPVASCERKRVVQILSNLVSNALKFTPTAGSIHLRAKREGAQVMIAVVDTGVGIPEDQIPRLFDRYWTGQRREGAGTGLGLYIVHGLVEAHGGRVQVTSRLGQGTTFAFTLPAA